MYSGLFGDLPSAKKQKGAPSATTNSNDDTDTKECDTNKEGPSSAVKSSSKSLPIPKGSLFAPPRQATANKNNKSQFLQTLGKSGTSMAFVPTAALKRKKTTTTNNNSNNNKSTTNVTGKDDEISKKVVSTSNSFEQPASFAAVTTTTTTTRVAASKTDKAAAVVDIHGTSNNVGTTKVSNSSAANLAPETPITHHNDRTTEEEKITDLYDPYVPNDLLEYWETLAAKKHREKLEQDTREALEQQRSMRKQLEEDRQALLKQAMASGGEGAFQSRGAGRGRGVSNLPAWLVEKQRSNGPAASDDVPSVRGRGRGVSNLPAWLVEKQRKDASNGQ